MTCLRKVLSRKHLVTCCAESPCLFHSTTSQMQNLSYQDNVPHFNFNNRISASHKCKDLKIKKCCIGRYSQYSGSITCHEPNGMSGAGGTTESNWQRGISGGNVLPYPPPGLHARSSRTYIPHFTKCRWRTHSGQLNSTENYGRRCLTPLSPHRNYILS